ncbi:hypothetical protein CDG60_16025 [Acinetobacter chinensis]|uniref:SRPBCC family protein n=1 Tax=Acinetobacter chinensis TaxID=2004650 RepID=A0A3B7M0Q2_9GAMM|nr:hypothetical protein [Acinetobacter chinensis]AXY57935.1 hypothetical protein CDG60_16025 [Acinetobacter chinensis]
MKKLTTAILFGALCTVPVAYANTPQPSVENAQKFIVEVLNAKATTFWSTPPSFVSNAKFKDKKIISASGDRCTTEVTVSYQESNILIDDRGSYVSKSNTATIAWNNISNVKRPYPNSSGEDIVIEGSITWNGGLTTSGVSFMADSVAMAKRLETAMNFLREQCDTKKSQYGF